ncbi:MAG: SRPBCC domain-containing protein [Actinomycetota bacterium]
MDPLPKVERTTRLEVDPTGLWEHLVKGDLASLWMGGEMTIEPRLGGRVSLEEPGAPPVFGTVEAIVSEESITWTWRTADGEPTQVTLRLEQVDGGTLLTVIEQMIPYEIIHIPPALG